MASPFPTLTDGERARLAEYGIDPDVSLRRWLTELTGPGRADELMGVEADHARGGQGRDLSPRELEVLLLYAEGWQETDMARLLHLSKHTVYAHMRAARAKLGARTIAHAVHLAHLDGLL